MQTLQPATTSRFMHGFWGVRQRLLRRIGPRIRERHGLELGELVLLDYVAGSDLTPSEIAEALTLPPHAVSRRIGGLEARDLLRREVHPDDARRRRLTLTEPGERARRAGNATLHDELDRMLGELSPGRLEVLVDALEQLAGPTLASEAGTPARTAPPIDRGDA